MNALVVAEHLAAIVVVTLIVAWLTVLAAVYQETVVPRRLQAEATYAANVALVSGQTQVMVGTTRWHVAVSKQRIEVQNGAHQFTFYPRDDAN